MAQMPASYLTEKVQALTRSWESLDASGRGVIELDARIVRTLDQMAQDARAIIDEIAEWTAGVDA